MHKSLKSFAFEVTQKQVGMDAALRDRTNQLNKTVEVERMHIQMKEAMSADISYLRRLNLQLVEAQMKGEEAWPPGHVTVTPCDRLFSLWARIPYLIEGL